MNKKNQSLVNSIIKGEAAEYLIEKELGRGGFGLTLLGRVKRIHNPTNWPKKSNLQIGSLVIVKIPNIDKSFSPTEKEKRIQYFNETLDREENARLKLRPSPLVPMIFDNVNILESIGNKYKIRTRYLIGEYIEGEDLDMFLCQKIYNSNNVADFSGIPDTKYFFELCKKLALLVKYIHERGVIHGDIWPKNILMNKNGDPILIDYGSSVFREYAFRRPPVGQTAIHPYTAPERRTRSGVRREGRRSDVYSMGGVCFFLATGKAPPQPIHNDDKLKNKIEVEINRVNPSLISKNRCVIDIIARCLRYRKEDRILNADQLLSEIQIFSLDAKIATNTLSISTLQGILENESKSIIKKKDSLFYRIIEMEYNSLLSRIRDMKRGILEVSGNHETIVSFLCQFISILSVGDIFLDFSIPKFWSPDNLGINGRFLSINEVLAIRGVIIRRIFMITQDELKKTEVKKIFNEHLKVMKRTRGINSQVILETYYRIITKKEQKNMLQNSEHCGILIQKKGKPKFIIPIYNTDGNIVTVRFLSKGQGLQRCIRRMDNEIANMNTRPLLTFPARKVP